MASAPPVKAVSENRRERETFRYDRSLISEAVYNDVNNLISPSDLRSSSDSALTAFAELGALRLNASRALISLFDSKFQYIVAEATPTLSLSPNVKHDDSQTGEQLLLSGTALPRSAGVCELVLAVPDSPNDLELRHDGDLPVTVIPDLAADARTAQRPFCLKSPRNRFYAGVPIRSPKGINIGVFCVFADEPREHLDAASSQLMQDISRVILDYLDAKRNRDDHRRADRMVRGVGSFVEGKATMSGWRMTTNPDSFQDNPSLEGALNKNQQQLQQQSELMAAEGSSLENVASAKWQRPSPGPQQPAASTKPQLGRSSSQELVPSVSGTSLKSVRSGSDDSVRGTRSSHESQIRNIFSRASNIVREAIEVESMLFLDASIGSFGGLANSNSFHVRSPGCGKSPSSSSDERSSSDQQSSGNGGHVKEDAFCRVLGFSSSAISSIDGKMPSQILGSIPERFLAKLLRRYPEGKIFNFDENGSIQSSDFSGDDQSMIVETPAQERCGPAPSTFEQVEEDRKRRKRNKNPFSRRNEGKILNSIYAQARSIALVPLWDAQKQRWYAGGLACTQTPTRVLTVEGELSYLRAFGAVIMSEVHRVNSMMVDEAKTDLLSSLSHELRSPLHGIILGAELLHDTPLDAFQGETLVSIENCGRTLLETIDHLLDWSKINNFIRPASKRRNSAAAVGDRGLRGRDQKISIEAGMMSLTSNVDIGVLCEEVVESVCAGFSYQRVSVAQLAGNRPDEHADANAIRRLDSMQAMEDMASRTNRFGDMQLVLGDVSITFDINPATSWAFHTQPGAIRRIIMNLLGNSLKYTSKGFVNVSVVQLGKKDHSSDSTKIQINVVDSGRGISEDYLRHHLFSPFSQENSLSAGAGLGLSLVNQIVVKLRGSIKVWSKVGHGTKVTVQLPLQGAIPTSPTPSHPNNAGFNDFQAHIHELGGLRVKLLGFPEDYGVQRVDNLASSTRSEGELVGNICRDWLNMQIIDQSVADQLLPDLVLSTEGCLDQLLSERRHGSIMTPVVVICRNALIARQLATSPRFTGKRAVFEFISQPLGPRKLAKVLLLSFRRWTRSQAGAIPTPTALSLTSAGRSNANADTPTGPKSATSLGNSTDALPELPGEDNFTLDSGKHDGPTGQPRTNGVEKRVEEFKETRPENSALPERRKREETPTTGNTPRDERASNGPEKRLKFLLVDDNPLNLKILESYMKKLGHEFQNATDGQQALEIFREGGGQFQCVLMDISMPIMDGFEATRRIRAIEAQEGFSRSHIFALTGLASASAQQEAFASGIDLFLTKPVRLKELNRILETKGVA